MMQHLVPFWRRWRLRCWTGGLSVFTPWFLLEVGIIPIWAEDAKEEKVLVGVFPNWLVEEGCEIEFYWKREYIFKKWLNNAKA